MPFTLSILILMTRAALSTFFYAKIIMIKDLSYCSFVMDILRDCWTDFQKFFHQSKATLLLSAIGYIKMGKTEQQQQLNS